MAITGFNIDAFRSNYADLARQYTFVIHLNNPFGSLTTEAMKYLVNASSMPGSTIDPIEAHWQGNIMPLASTHTFEDWTVTFKCDAKAQVRKDLLTWQKSIHDPKTNLHAAPNTYMVDQEAWQLDTSGNPVHKIKLVGAWPTVVGELTLDYSAKDLATFDCSFRYIRHETIG